MQHHANKPVYWKVLIWIVLIFALLLCAVRLVLPRLTNESFDKSVEQYSSCMYGVIDDHGKVVIEPKFEQIHPFESEITNVIYQGRARFIDKNGDFVGTAKYQYAKPFAEGLAPVSINGKWGFIDTSGTLSIPAKYDNAERFSEGRASVSTGGLCGFIDKLGSVAVKAKFESVGSFKEELAWAKTKAAWLFYSPTGVISERPDIEEIYPQINAKPNKLTAASANVRSLRPSQTWGLIDNTGRFVVDPIYTEVPSVNNDRALLVNDKSAVLADMSGRILAKFDGANPTLFEIAIVKRNEKWGVSDLNGRFLIHPQFDQIHRLAADLLAVQQGGKIGIMDSSSRWLVPLSAGNELLLDTMRFRRSSSGRWVLDNKNGERFSIRESRDDLKPISQQDRWGAVDQSGKTVIKCLYDRPVGFDKNGFCLTSKNGQPIIVDRKGQEFDLRKIQLFSGNRAERRQPLCGFINKDGSWKIKPSFDDTTDFNFSLASFHTKEKWGVVDKSGNVVRKADLDFVGAYSADGLAPFRKGAHWGFLDRSGEICIEAKYDEARAFNEGFAAVRKRASWGFIDSAGSEKISAAYAGVSNFSNSSAIVWKANPMKTAGRIIDFVLIDPGGRILAGPYAGALQSANGMASVTDDFQHWKLLNSKGQVMCSFKHYSPLGSFDPMSSLPLLDDRMVVFMPRITHK